MEIDEPLKNAIIAALLLGLVPIAYHAYKATKKSVKIGALGHLAITIDSLVTRSPQKVNEMNAMLKNQTKKVNPQDK